MGHTAQSIQLVNPSFFLSVRIDLFLEIFCYLFIFPMLMCFLLFFWIKSNGKNGDLPMMAWNLWNLNYLFWWQLQAFFRGFSHFYLSFHYLFFFVWVLLKMLRWWSHWALNVLNFDGQCSLESYVWSITLHMDFFWY